ncbi:hypothetical protein QGU_3821 [Clostridioides difficile 655]|nr:hypothetical protein QGU_3821 [Clostridioides difficile 655]EQI22432.1 hypothetical protein QOK_0951 [Clostridioides difficile Y41]
MKEDEFRERIVSIIMQINNINVLKFTYTYLIKAKNKC